VEATERGAAEVACWGDGTPSRESLYVDDCARGVLAATELYHGGEPVNLGCEQGVRMTELGHRECGVIKRILQRRYHSLPIGDWSNRPYTGEAKVNYVDYANTLAHIIDASEAQWGVLMCGTGAGMSIVASRSPHTSTRRYYRNRPCGHRE
jgi:UDP-glucose 4-epimerase